jgi:hypothetical protein
MINIGGSMNIKENSILNWKKDFRVHVDKATGLDWLQRACSDTIDAKSNMTLDKIYQCMHSPMRTQIFYIQLKNIPSFVATHLVRHVTIVPFVKSNRTDRRKEYSEEVNWVNSLDEALEVGRLIPVNMGFIANAESLINISWARLCFQASPETRYVIEALKREMELIDYDLSFRMVPKCVGQRQCRDGKRSCGFLKKFLDKNPELCNKESLLDADSWYRAFVAKYEKRKKE